MDNQQEEKEPIYSLFPTTKYRKDYDKFLTQESKLHAINAILIILAYKGAKGIPLKHRPHILKGNYKGCWECHILPDLLLIWKQEEEEKEITLYRGGSHSEVLS